MKLRRHWIFVWLALSVVLVACAETPRIERSEACDLALDTLRVELAAGRPLRARDELERARALQPDRPAVLLWDAVLASMHWDDERALASLEGLRGLVRSGSVAFMQAAEIEGRIGEIHVRGGDQRRAALALQVSVVSTDTAEREKDRFSRRQALLNLARRLPPNRDEPPRIAVELPLIDSVLPRLLCRFGEGDTAREVPFVLDTGATFTTVTRAIARRLAIATVDPSLTVTDGRGRPIDARFGVLPAMALGGGVEIAPRPVLVAESPLLEVQLGDAVPSAVVGLDLLARYRVTLDPGDGTALFELPNGQPVEDSVQSLLVDGRVLVPVECESTRLWFILDTGATRSSLSPVGLRALPGGERRGRDVSLRADSPGGSSPVVRQVNGLVLQIGDLRVARVDLPVVGRAASPQFPVHGVLGSDILRRCRITFDKGLLRLSAVRGS